MQAAAQGRACPSRGLRAGGRSAAAAAASRLQVVPRRVAPQPPAAAASVDVVPYVSSAAPKLRGRHISGNPLEWAWSVAAAGATRLELLAAASVDRLSFGPALMAGLAGATTALGVDGLTLLQHGLSPGLQDLLLQAFGIWDSGACRVALAAVAVPSAAWALRCWWVANTQLLNSPGGLVQHLLHPQQQQQQQQDDLGNWVLLGLVVARVLCLGTAVSRAAVALASTNATTAAMNAAAAFAAATVAAAPVLLQLTLFGSSSSSSSSSGGGASSGGRASLVQATALMLLAEVSWVVAAIGVAPLLNAVAGAAIAASLLLLHRQLVAPRLAAYQAALGDAAEVHVALRLEGSTAVFDSTLSEQPLPILVARRPAEHVQLWQELSSRGYWDHDENGDQQQQDATAAAATAPGSGEQQLDPSGLFAVQQDIQAWLREPSARWEVLLPIIADAAAGLYLGEQRRLALFNPANVGYWNPRFSWFQPTDDVAAKFKGQRLEAGDVFWYPVAEGASLPTRVVSVGEAAVELDANYGVAGAALQLEVTLVRLYKAPADEEQQEGQEQKQQAAAVLTSP